MPRHHRTCNCPNPGNGNIYYNSLNDNGRRPYGVFRFLFDIFMIVITGGLWLIWIFIREMRNR